MSRVGKVTVMAPPNSSLVADIVSYQRDQRRQKCVDEERGKMTGGRTDMLDSELGQVS